MIQNVIGITFYLCVWQLDSVSDENNETASWKPGIHVAYVSNIWR